MRAQSQGTCDADPMVAVVHKAGRTHIKMPYYNIGLVNAYTACYSQIHIDQGKRISLIA